MRTAKSIDNSPYSTLEQSPISSNSIKVPLSESFLDPSVTGSRNGSDTQTCASLYETSRKSNPKNASKFSFNKTVSRSLFKCLSEINGRKLAKISGCLKRTKRPATILAQPEMPNQSQIARSSPKSEAELAHNSPVPSEKLTHDSKVRRWLFEESQEIQRVYPKSATARSKYRSLISTITLSSSRKSVEFPCYQREASQIRFSYNVPNDLQHHSNDDDCDTDEEQIKRAIEVCTRDLVIAIKASIDDAKTYTKTTKRGIALQNMVASDGRQVRRYVD